MKAVVWNGARDMRVERVPDPRIENPRDIIIKVTSTAICGSDLHLYNKFIPFIRSGDILGHEFMGEVVEVGSAITKFKKGDRVVNPFTIQCGQCWFCQRHFYSQCDNSNPNSVMAEKVLGQGTSGFFGYTVLFGGYAGGQAEYARIPYADVGPMLVPEGMPDEKVLFLSDIFPTGYMAAEQADIEPGDTVAVWGCGPVGLFTIKSAFMLGAERVIAIDRLPERLALARDECGAEILDYTEVSSVVDTLREMTGGRGPDRCIDAVGMEAHGTGMMYAYDRAKQALMLESDRPIVLREAILACRKAGTISIAGVYSGLVDKIPMGAAFNKALTLKMGQTHMKRYMEPLLQKVQNGEIDPSFLITHPLPLEEAPHGYRIFNDKKDECIKVVMKP